MKTLTQIIVLIVVAISFHSQADPQLSSWFTSDSGRYARIYTDTASQMSGNAVTTWSRGTETQSLPAYSGVQEVDSSSNWIYIRSTGLGFHVMGPWYLDAMRTNLFPNLPVNTKTFTRFPRVPTVSTTKTATGLGAIGCFVDGVAMYNSWDAYFWNGTTNANSGSSTGYYWRRDAYVNEGMTFDAGNAHQDQSGTYHYHANPPALRYLLGDSVSYNSVSNVYTETPTNLHHSPILGWANDGLPIYGPYGYSNATNANSGIRRMISGYVLRNGQNGTDNLNVTGRTTIPAWAARLFGVTTNQSGPSTVGNALGIYMEDNDYLGDHGYTQGVDFDLDEYNSRFCVTPEFPNGTNVYFVSISSNGTPVYPYNIAGGFYGTPTGGTVSNLAESVVTNYLGGPNTVAQLSAAIVNTNNLVTLLWSGVEGGIYKVQSSADLQTWTNKVAGVLAASNVVRSSFTDAGQSDFYQVVMTNLASYDPVTSTGSASGGITSVSPTAHARGSSFVLTVNLSSTANPAPPPVGAPIISVSIGTNSGASLTHVSQTEVQATFDLAGTTGAQTVTVIFPGPMGNPTSYVTYTLGNGFTVQ